MKEKYKSIIEIPDYLEEEMKKNAQELYDYLEKKYPNHSNYFVLNVFSSLTIYIVIRQYFIELEKDDHTHSTEYLNHFTECFAQYMKDMITKNVEIVISHCSEREFQGE